MLYEKAKKTKHNQHPYAKELFDCNLSVIADHIGVSRVHLTNVLNGGRQSSKSFDIALEKVVNQIKKERLIYQQKN